MATGHSYEFQAETRQLLDLVVHSLYSNKEIFLRELISNASDALDRLRFESITKPELLRGDPNLEVRLETDTHARTLTITDNGIGMSKDELIDNIGTIAQSGTRELLARLKESKDTQIPPEFIGQFGVGFYSSFMVADKVTLVTQRAGESRATQWESTGDGTYQIADTEKTSRGTSVTLHLKAVDDEDGVEDYTSEYVLSRIVKKYSDFVTHPIKLEVEREAPPEEDASTTEKSQPAKVHEERTLNSMKAIWMQRSGVTQSEYNEFYHHIAHDTNDAFEVMTLHAEGKIEFDALMFIPAVAPYELYYQAYQSGLQLYVKKVKILEHCDDLLHRHLRFIRGVVDCPDLPLNVSREMLQHTREINKIRNAITRKVLDTLTAMHESEPQRYLTFWEQFGRALKEGISTDFDNKDRLTKLFLFQSSDDPEKLTTLSDYLGRMSDDQNEIYYVTGESRAIVENLPHLEALRDKGYEVLYLVDPVDELLVQHLYEFEGKRLKSVGKGVMDLGTEDEKEESKKQREEQQKEAEPFLACIQKALDEHVKEVRLSGRLKSSPACLVGAEYDYSPQLEKLLLKGKGGGPKQRRILEINPGHPIVERLRKTHASNAADPRLTDFAELLLGQALLTEGSELPDPVKFSRQVADLMIHNLQDD